MHCKRNYGYIFEHFVYILVLQVAMVLYSELSTIWHTSNVWSHTE